MILRLIKGNHVINAFLIPIFGIAFWIKSLMSPDALPFYEWENLMPLFRITGNYLQTWPFWSTLAGLILTLLNAFLIVRISITFQFLRSRSFMPGIIYVILVSTFKSLHTLHPAHIAAFIILLMISDLLNTYQESNSISSSYKNSFFIAIASLFYLPAALLIPLVWISNYLLQKGVNWRHFIVPLFGFVSPWIITIAIMFLMDKSQGFFSDLERVLNSDKPWDITNPKFYVPVAWFIILLIPSSNSILGRYDEKKISSRKILSIFFWMALLLAGTILLLKFVGEEVLILILIPVSYGISHYFLFAKRRFFPQLFFTILLLITILSIFVIE